MKFQFLSIDVLSSFVKFQFLSVDVLSSFVKFKFLPIDILSSSGVEGAAHAPVRGVRLENGGTVYLENRLQFT